MARASQGEAQAILQRARRSDKLRYLACLSRPAGVLASSRRYAPLRATVQGVSVVAMVIGFYGVARMIIAGPGSGHFEGYLLIMA